MELVVAEVSQIQRYIFTSNRLRENVGASYLVSQAVEDWALEVVCKEAKQNNIRKSAGENAYELDDSKCIEDNINLDAEVLYTGGGNFVALFRESETATKFVRALSRKALTDAPGLQLVMARREFSWSNSLSSAVAVVFNKLEDNKRACGLSSPLLGLGVTAACSSTGLPAVKFQTIGDESFLAGAETLAKLEIMNEARKKLTKSVKLRLEEYDFPIDIDLLGRTRGEQSHIAVVHIDGNDMAQRKKKIGEKFGSNNRGYILAMRNFSRGVKEASINAFKKTVLKLRENIIDDEESGGKCIDYFLRDKEGKKMELITKLVLAQAGDNKYYLPLLPIVYGGDDLTFVCDGRIALSLACQYIGNLEEETVNSSYSTGRVSSCAGIVIVRPHFPFAQAYKLAEELCQSAKKYRRQINIDTSCLDWHFALSGFTGDLEVIRNREYLVGEGWLTLRPVTLGENTDTSYRAWQIIEKLVKEFQGEKWYQRRNKMKALRDALRGGRNEVEQFILKYRIGKLPVVEEGIDSFRDRGWHGEYCGYFDALELADFYIPLEEGKK